MNQPCSFGSLQIWTSDFERSFAFYRDVVGMEEVHRDGNVFGILKLGEFQIDLDTDEDEREQNPDLYESLTTGDRGAGFYLTFEVEDVDAKFQEVQDQGYLTVVPQWGDPIQEPVKMPWGSRQFGTFDPAGYHVVFSKSS